MALELRVEIPPSSLRALRSILNPDRMAWVEKEALNRTAGNVQTLALQLVSSQMGISPEKLAKRGRKFSSSSSAKYGAVRKGKRATNRRLFTSVQGVGRPFNVVRFGGVPIRNENNRIVGVAHAAWGRQQTAMNVWQLVNRPGTPFVVRKGKSFRGVFGPGVRAVMEYPHNKKALEKEALARFAHHFNSRMRYAFGTTSHLR